MEKPSYRKFIAPIVATVALAGSSCEQSTMNPVDMEQANLNRRISEYLDEADRQKALAPTPTDTFEITPVSISFDGNQIGPHNNAGGITCFF